MHAELPRFTGSVEHALDDKGRLIVPARFRERLGAGFVLTIAQPDPCLVLYPTVTWAEFCNRLEAAPRKDERFRRLVRHLFRASFRSLVERFLIAKDVVFATLMHMTCSVRLANAL